MSIKHTPDSEIHADKEPDNLPFGGHEELTSPALILGKKIAELAVARADNEKLQAQVVVAEAENAQLAANLAEVLAENVQLADLAEYWRSQAEHN